MLMETLAKLSLIIGVLLLAYWGLEQFTAFAQTSLSPILGVLQ